MPALTLRAKPKPARSTSWQCADSPTGAHYWLMDVYTGTCQYCHEEKTWLPEGVEPQKTVARIIGHERNVEQKPKPTDGLKACAMCGEKRPLSEYPVYGKVRRKRVAYCGVCRKLKDKIHNAARRQAEEIMRGLRG